MQLNRYSLIALSLTGGFLSGLAWTDWCPGLILLVSFIPFLIIEEHIFRNPERYSSNAYFIYVLPGFVIFTITTLGWMRVASMTGALLVTMGLSFLMSFTLWLAHLVRTRVGNLPGFISFIVFWLSFEFISLNTTLVTPWLNLGNGLAKDISIIQWYDATGTAGGSLWILLSNLFLARVVLDRKHKMSMSAIWLIIVFVPVSISLLKLRTIVPSDNAPIEVVIIQPNIDPYTEKFVIPWEEQLNDVLSLAETSVTGTTNWIVTPETTIDDPVNLDQPADNKYIDSFRKFAANYPQTSIVAGLVSYRLYQNTGEVPTISARKVDSSNVYYDHFNSAFRIDTGKSVEVYHKSKLVPGIEMQFINGPGRLIARILPYLGGTKWGYGMQEEREIFTHHISGNSIAPVICYESVFGSYVTEYVRKGAEALFIITNDGWWKNTNGYKQHLYYASLRAVETRRPVIRSANTGISCVIDIKGKRFIESEWWTKQVFKSSFTPEKKITFYVKYGDYLLRISVLVSVMIILITFVSIPLRKKLYTN